MNDFVLILALGRSGSSPFLLLNTGTPRIVSKISAAAAVRNKQPG
jgi:hypothetical protein